MRRLRHDEIDDNDLELQPARLRNRPRLQRSTSFFQPVCVFSFPGDEATDVNFEVRMEIDDPLTAKAITSVYSLIAEAQIEAFESEISLRSEMKLKQNSSRLES